MALGISIGDFIKLIELARDTYRNCRAAPSEFREAGEAAKSLHTILKGLKDDVRNPQSPLGLHTDGFTEILWNCEKTLRRLDGIISNHSSLGTSNRLLRHRIKFPVKDLQDIRSKLMLHISALSVFLQKIRLTSLGRTAEKIDDGVLRILNTIDRIGAEIRAGRREGTVMTDYTDGDPSVW